MGKGKSNSCEIPKSSVLRCFRSRKRQLVWSGVKEWRVIEDDVGEGKEAARSHRACIVRTWVFIPREMGSH